jgi:septum formation protein
VYYVDKFSPMDKAGAYAIQEWIGEIGITQINGSYHNVVGMPMAQLYSALKTFVE